MLSYETYEKLTKKDTYALYTTLYKQKEEEESMKNLLTQLLTRMDDTNQLLVKSFQCLKENKNENVSVE